MSRLRLRSFLPRFAVEQSIWLDRPRRERRELAHGEPDTPWFTASYTTNETHQQLERAVKDLAPMYREVVTLKIWGELTFQEIANTIGIPLNTAASRYRYGLDQLRESMKETLR